MSCSLIVLFMYSSFTVKCTVAIVGFNAVECVNHVQVYLSLSINGALAILYSILSKLYDQLYKEHLIYSIVM